MDNNSKASNIAIDGCLCAIFVVLSFIALNIPLDKNVATIGVGSIFLAMYNDKKYYRVFRVFFCSILVCFFAVNIHTWLIYVVPNYLILTLLSLIKKDNFVKFIVYTIVFFCLSLLEEILYCEIVLGLKFMEYLLTSNSYLEIIKDFAHAETLIIVAFIFASIGFSIAESFFFFSAKRVLNKRLGHLIEKI